MVALYKLNKTRKKFVKLFSSSFLINQKEYPTKKQFERNSL